ncbi:MAG: hypothetical protein EOO54_06485 [Haliea sp.]|nr:MAG: hypothetical protein EOO54_06485 [Haliea sp.]
MNQASAGRSHCPLCGNPNGCAMEGPRASADAQPPCWCTQVDFSRELLERVPARDRGRACICSTCARQDAAD